MTTTVTVICEGQTEEASGNALVKPLLENRNITAKFVLIGKRGGGVASHRLLKDITNILGTDDAGGYATTLIDYYGLPEAFPNHQKAKQAY